MCNLSYVATHSEVVARILACATNERNSVSFSFFFIFNQNVNESCEIFLRMCRTFQFFTAFNRFLNNLKIELNDFKHWNVLFVWSRRSFMSFFPFPRIWWKSDWFIIYSMIQTHPLKGFTWKGWKTKSLQANHERDKLCIHSE